eukprot:3273849-Alexandrium_andersonii.AAC.1
MGLQLSLGRRLGHSRALGRGFTSVRAHPCQRPLATDMGVGHRDVDCPRGGGASPAASRPFGAQRLRREEGSREGDRPRRRGSLRKFSHSEARDAGCSTHTRFKPDRCASHAFYRDGPSQGVEAREAAAGLRAHLWQHLV